MSHNYARTHLLCLQMENFMLFAAFITACSASRIGMKAALFALSKSYPFVNPRSAQHEDKYLKQSRATSHRVTFATTVYGKHFHIRQNLLNQRDIVNRKFKK